MPPAIIRRFNGTTIRMLFTAYAPVSYTHLSSEKRQAQRGYHTGGCEQNGRSCRGGGSIRRRPANFRREPLSLIHIFILAFEQLEAMRWLPFLKKGGTVITNIQKINPMPVVSGAEKYPEHLIELLQKSEITTIAVDALGIAEECGSAKAVNVVLLGVLASKLTEIPQSVWYESLKSVIPAKLYEINEKAFQKGLSV